MKDGLSLVGLACAFIMADLVDDLHQHPLTENAEFEAHRRGSILLGELWRTQRYRVRSKRRVERAADEVAMSRGDARARAELELYRAQDSARTWRARARKAQQAWDAWRAEAPEAHALYQEIRHERYRSRVGRKR